MILFVSFSFPFSHRMFKDSIQTDRLYDFGFCTHKRVIDFFFLFKRNFLIFFFLGGDGVRKYNLKFLGEFNSGTR